MRELLQSVRARLQRDRELSLRQIATKGMRFARELATAPLYLRDVDEVGTGVRTLHRPRIDNQGRMVIGAGSILRSVNVPVELVTGPQGLLEIGRDVLLNYGVSIGAMKSVRLGARVLVGPYVMIIDTEFHDMYDRSLMPDPRPVTLEDDVWIGAKASVLPGVTIGRGAVVAAAAVVAADVPPFTVVGGVPAREIKRLDPSRFVVQGERRREV